jgi:uncharacterized surface protein with fasciclin (FAS1) repeats
VAAVAAVAASSLAAKSVGGKTLKIKSADGKVMMDNAARTKTDIAASSDVLHVIDRALIPGRAERIGNRVFVAGDAAS